VYGTSLNARIAGTFQNLTSLSNGGETLTLADSAGTVILRVSYGDSFPWPAEADGAGYSLVFSGGDPEDALNWRRSLNDGGSPAASDALSPAGDPLTMLKPLLEVELHPETNLPHFLVHAHFRLGADHLLKSFELSPDLEQWAPPTTAPLLTARRTEGGDEILTWKFDLPAMPGKLFLRMTVKPR